MKLLLNSRRPYTGFWRSLVSRSGGAKRSAITIMKSLLHTYTGPLYQITNLCLLVSLGLVRWVLNWAWKRRLLGLCIPNASKWKVSHIRAIKDIIAWRLSIYVSNFISRSDLIDSAYHLNQTKSIANRVQKCAFCSYKSFVSMFRNR